MALSGVPSFAHHDPSHWELITRVLLTPDHQEKVYNYDACVHVSVQIVGVGDHWPPYQADVFVDGFTDTGGGTIPLEAGEGDYCFTYGGWNGPGRSFVTASVEGNGSNTVTVDWNDPATFGRPKAFIEVLTPPTETLEVGEETEVDVSVTNENGGKWSGTLHWSTTYFDGMSANDARGSFSVTNGRGSFAYVGTREGRDFVHVSDGYFDYEGVEAVGVVERTWVGPGPEFTVVTEVRPVQEVNPAGNYTDFLVFARDQDGAPWTGYLVWTSVYPSFGVSANYVSGAVHIVDGSGTFGYTGAETGEDTIKVGLPGSTGTTQVATRTWTQPGPDPCDLVPLDADGQVLPTSCDVEGPSDPYASLVAATTGPCAGLYQIAGTDACTHGPDFVAAAALGTFDELADTEDNVSTALSPAPPTGLTAAVVSSTQVNLSWSDNSANEDGFKIQRSTDAGDAWNTIFVTPPNVASFANTGLKPESTYTYRIKAYNAAGSSAASNTAEVTTPAAPPPTPSVPAAPSGLSAVVNSSSQIELTWTDNASNEDGFKLERSTAGGASVQVETMPANSTRFLDSGLSPSTTYSYKLRAFNTGGDSSYSNTASGTTPSVTSAPSAPSNLSASSMGSGEIRLTWSDNSSNEEWFKIEISSDGGVNWQQIGSTPRDTNSFDSTGLSPQSTYHYRVRAYNSGGNSGYSNTTWATTPAAHTDSEPTGEHNAYEEEPGYDQASDPDYQAATTQGNDPGGTALAEASSSGSQDALCQGDGRSGFRVQAIYAIAKGEDSRYLNARDTIREYAQRANRPVFQSSADNHRRKIRFVCNSLGQIAVRKVVIPPETDNDLGFMFEWLHQETQKAKDLRPKPESGLDRADRKYLIWVDRINPYLYGGGDKLPCGTGEFPPDNQRTTAKHVNYSEWGTEKYAAVYFVRCAGRTDDDVSGENTGSAETHELMHTLGAVQPEAPHGTDNNPDTNFSDGLHCWDNWDVMCYDDMPPHDDGWVYSHGARQRMRVLCPSMAMENRLDCGNDDYFNSALNVGGWLGNHWNTADSRFLIPNNAATVVNCQPETADPPPGGTHTIACRATDAMGTPIGGAEIDIELSGTNDPDAGDTRGSPDFTCRTASDGTCSISHGPTSTTALGTTLYRAWIDRNYSNASSEADASEGQDETSSPGGTSEPDDTDVVSAAW